MDKKYRIANESTNSPCHTTSPGGCCLADGLPLFNALQHRSSDGGGQANPIRKIELSRSWFFTGCCCCASKRVESHSRRSHPYSLFSNLPDVVNLSYFTHNDTVQGVPDHRIRIAAACGLLGGATWVQGVRNGSAKWIFLTFPVSLQIALISG